MSADNKKQQTKKALIEALTKSLGIVSQACDAVGINRTTFYRYYKEDPDFRDEVDDVSERAIDFAESHLLKQIKDGNCASTIFYLKTKGKQRGYVERSELYQNHTIEDIETWAAKFRKPSSQKNKSE